MEVNFLNQKPCISSWPFQFDILFSAVLSKSSCFSILGSSSSPSSSLVMLFIHSAFSLCFFGSHILAQNRSVSFASGCWYVFVSLSPSCWSNFLSLFWKVLFCLYCFTLSRYLFNLPSLASTFWFISSSFTVIFPHVACSFFPRLFHRLSSSFGLVFAFFFICDSSLNSHPGFCCFYVLFEGIPIFSQTIFAPAYINSFNSVISFVGM